MKTILFLLGVTLAPIVNAASSVVCQDLPGPVTRATRFLVLSTNNPEGIYEISGQGSFINCTWSCLTHPDCQLDAQDPFKNSDNFSVTCHDDLHRPGFHEFARMMKIGGKISATYTYIMRDTPPIMETEAYNFCSLE